MKRKYPIGPEILNSGVSFRVWAPECEKVEVILNEKQTLSLSKEKEGYFSLFTKDASSGTFYQYRLDQSLLVSDPASKYQPKGILGSSCIVDESQFKWSDQDWKGIESIKRQVIYELHVGTFTQEGTWQAAMKKLPELAELGITLIEMMPVGEFAGEFGWGYDGIYLFAPYHVYGTPDDLKAFVNQAHLQGIGVILDGVYNHFGPDYELHKKFTPHYFDKHNHTDWGLPLNFGEKPVREFVISNVLYWIDEFHFDGIRFDAIQNIYDQSSFHIIAEASEAAREKIKNRKLIFIGENETQEIKLIKPLKQGGMELDAVWNDDFHHSARVFLTGRQEAYYRDYKGYLQEFISSLKYGYLYQGQFYPWQKKSRGTASLDIEYDKFVIYLQNHDQVANSTRSLRIHEMASIPLLRIMTTLLLLAPQTPLLFQGQEFGSSNPFYYFADHDFAIDRSVWEGRKQFLSQFQSFKDPETQKYFADPGDKNTFLKCKLNWEEKSQSMHQALYLFHRDLIKLRREDSVFSCPLKIDGAILAPGVCLFRYFGKEDDDRLILCNFESDYSMGSIPEPLYAPPSNKKWRLLFSSQNPLYGGFGNPEVKETEWILAGHTALILKAEI